MSKFLKSSTGMPRGSTVQGTDIGSGAATSSQGLFADGASGAAFRSLLAGDLPTITLTGDVTGSASGGSIATSIGNNKVTNSMLAQMAANTFKGNNTGGTANATDLTATQATAMLNTFTSSLQGLVPASGGGTAAFLRADGTFTATGAAATKYNVTSQTTTYPASINDYVVCSSASFTVTLPTAVGQTGELIVIQHNGTSLSQVYTLNTTSSQTIGGIASGSYALYTAGETLTLISDGSNWQIQDHMAETAWTSYAYSLTATAAYTFTIPAATITAGSVYSNNGNTYTTTTSISGGTTITAYGTGSPAATGAYTFTGLPSSSITAGTVYTNNGQTFTVINTTSSSTTLICSGTGAPSASGTLTFVSGSPSGNKTFTGSAASGALVFVSGSGPSIVSFSASTTTGVPAKGTNTTDSFLWKRRGEDMLFQYTYVQTAAGTAGTGTYLFGLPDPSMTISSNVLTAGAAAGTTSAIATALGHGTTSNTSTGIGSQAGAVCVYAYDTTHFSLKDTSLAGTGNYNLVGSASLAFSNTNLQYMATGSVQITGWRP